MIHLVHLYPREMNIYGDTGNLLVLQKRMQWRGIEVKTSFVGVGGKIPEDVDIILGGGGQDAGQLKVEADLQAKAADLKNFAEKGVVMLMVCGMYQMFCRQFITNESKTIKGIGIFAGETKAGSKRVIGNFYIKTQFGELIGYENHSGKTYLDNSSQALGRVVRGGGNNSQDKLEGAVYKNVFGTYMHGPILAKNPNFADELIARAIKSKELNLDLMPLDDQLELTSKKIAKKRPR